MIKNSCADAKEYYQKMEKEFSQGIEDFPNFDIAASKYILLEYFTSLKRDFNYRTQSTSFAEIMMWITTINNWSPNINFADICEYLELPAI